MSLRNTPRIIKFRDKDIYVFESKHSPNFSMPMETRDYQKLALIIKGKGFLKTENSRIELSENHLIYIPTNLPHCFEDDHQNPLTLVMSCFYDKMFTANPTTEHALRSFQNTFPHIKPFILSDNFARAEVISKFRRMIFEQIQRQENADALIWSQLVELIVFLTRNYRESQKILTESISTKVFAGSIQYLENNFYKPIKVEDLARMANMSYRRYTEFFKQTMNKTVIEYLTEIRIKYSQKLITETENVIYAAFEAGFGDVAHFYRVFKKQTGRTPKQYIFETRSRSINQ